MGHSLSGRIVRRPIGLRRRVENETWNARPPITVIKSYRVRSRRQVIVALSADRKQFNSIYRDQVVVVIVKVILTTTSTCPRLVIERAHEFPMVAFYENMAQISDL
jgi:hypothetical protein